MSYEKLIQNIERLSAERGVNKTTALVDSGAGKNFIYNINRGSDPSTEKIQQLAAYFNVSTDYLLGNETKSDDTPATDRQLKFALFGTTDIDDDLLEDIRSIAKTLKERKKGAK